MDDASTTYPALIAVHSATYASLPDFIVLDITQQFKDGDEIVEYRGPYGYSATDPYGLAPTIRQWLADNPDFPIAPYVPPTIEDKRQNAPPVNRVIFRNRARGIGITTAAITDYLASITDPDHQEEMQVFWEDSQSFARLDVFCVELGSFAGKSPEEMDTIWQITA